MQKTNDLKLGLIGLAIILVLVFAIRYVRKADILSSDKKIYAVFQNVAGLELTNKVIIEGLPIGSVLKLQPADENLTGVKVTLKIDDDFNIPDNSVAHIEGNPMSSYTIIIDKGNSKNYLENRDIIKTKENNSLAELQAQAKPLMEKVNNISDSLSIILNNSTKKLNASKQEDIRRKIANINAKFASYYAGTERMKRQMDMRTTNMLAMTNKLKGGQTGTTNMISKANERTNKLAQINLQQKVGNINSKVSHFRGKINQFSNGKLDSLTSSRDFYDNLNNNLLQTEMILDDIRVHPKRHIDYSVIGKSGKTKQKTEPQLLTERRKRNSEFNRRQQEQYKLK